MELTGATALVTGGGKRLGAAMATLLVRRGVHTAIHYQGSRAEALALAARLEREAREAGRETRVTTAAGDLSDPEAAAGVVRAVRAQLGGVRILINNAAIFEPGSLRGTTPESWARHLAINLTAPFLLMREFALQPELTPHSEQAGASSPTLGVVINLLDQRILHPRPGHLAYTAAKEGLWSLTRMAAAELAPEIRVNAIAPGPILPAPDDADGSRFAEVAAGVPLKRGGSPDEIAAAALFLLQHDYVTGQMVCVDGGQHLT